MPVLLRTSTCLHVPYDPSDVSSDVVAGFTSKVRVSCGVRTCFECLEEIGLLAEPVQQVVNFKIFAVAWRLRNDANHFLVRQRHDVTMTSLFPFTQKTDILFKLLYFQLRVLYV